MSKFKKALMAIVATTMVATNAVGLASCGKKDGFSEVDVVTYDGSKVTVTFYHTMGQKLIDILDEYLKEFNTMYPNITVKHSSPSQDYDELREIIEKGLSNVKAPSIAYCYPDHVAAYNAFDAVVTLDDYMAHSDMGFTDEQLADFYPTFLEEGRCFGDDKTYTLPYLKSTEVLYYNKTFFDANDLTVPTTWAEMWDTCAQIKEITKKADGTYDSKVVPFGYDSEANWFITMTEQRGTGYTTHESPKFIFNNEENRAFVEELRGYFKQGYFTTKALNGKTYTSKLFNVSHQNDTMRCYMCVGSTGGSSYQVPDPVNGKDPFEVGVAMMPQETKDTKDFKVLQQGPSICIFKQSDPQEVAASWLLAKFLTTSIGYQASSSLANGYTPVIQSVAKDGYYAEQLEIAKTSTDNADLPAKTIAQALAQAPYYYTSKAFDGSSTARTYVGLIMQACLNSDVSIKSEFDKKTNYLINKYN